MPPVMFFSFAYSTPPPEKNIITSAITFRAVQGQTGRCFVLVGMGWGGGRKERERTENAASFSLCPVYLIDSPTSSWHTIYQFISPTSSQSLLAAKYKIQIQPYADRRHCKPV